MILQDLFPITGPLREPLLILECLIIFLFLEQAFILWLRARAKKGKDLKTLQEKRYVWLFFGYAIMWIFIVISDFHIQDPFLKNIFLDTGFTIQILCLLIFLNRMEKYKTYLYKYLFTKISIFIIIIYIIVLVFDFIIASFFASVFWLIFIIFFTVYFKELSSNFHVKKEIINLKLEILKFYLSVLITTVGYQLTTRFFVKLYGLNYRVLGDILQLLGLFLLAWFFMSVPSFTEYTWRDKIESIFIVHNSGLLIYKKKFRESSDPLDEALVSGILTMSKMMLEKTINKDGQSFIEKSDKKILIQPGKNISVFLICDENLKSIQILLNKLIERIETVYSNILEEWKGNLNVFLSMESIVKEIFF